jgi:uncharacterized protein (TIGR02300 family)
MKKAASKSPVANLGSKRQCPKCATKFYDFGKEEIVCPKCGTEIDPNALVQIPKSAPEPKRPTKIADVDSDDEVARPEGAAVTSDEFESVEDLADDEEDLVGGAVDDEEDESY